MAKRAKTSTDDEPPASTASAPEAIIISPEPSPLHSPQRESITHSPQASVGVCFFITDTTGLVGEEREQGELSETIPDAPPLSTTPPRDGSPARSSTGEPTRAEEKPASAGAASTGAGNPTSATGVAGKGEATSQQLNTGKLLTLKCLLFFLSFCLLELPPQFHLVYFFRPSDLPSTKHMNIDTVIEETARNAAAEADKVVADEAVKDTTVKAAEAAQEGAAKKSAERAGKGTGDHTDGISAAGAPGATPVTKLPAVGEVGVEEQPSTSSAPRQAGISKLATICSSAFRERQALGCHLKEKLLMRTSSLLPGSRLSMSHAPAAANLRKSSFSKS